MSKIIGKRYYKIDFKLASALSVGGNISFSTDRDIVYNGNGIPYIPASTLAGIYRGFYSDKTADKYFGSKSDYTDSKIYIYDAEIKENKYNVSKRDCVGLDKWKTSIEGAKFDFEVIEAGAEFVTYMEQDIYESDKYTADVVADMWAADKIRIGGKTSRGLGKVKTKSVKMKSFLFKNDNSVKDWLDFDMYDEECWKGCIVWNSENDKENHWSENTEHKRIILQLSLKQVSPIIIRTYTTDIEDADYKQLTYTKYNNEGKESVAVIPGTSWAGSFRHHMENMNICDIKKIFGYCEKNKSQSSSVYFSESIIEGSKSKTVSRNSIDRFSGGTIDGALFTESMCYGGRTSLEIEFDINSESGFYKAIAMSVADLNEGFISVGGETSVGHGIFSVTDIKCNGNNISMAKTAEEFYENIFNAIENERRTV